MVRQNFMVGNTWRSKAAYLMAARKQRENSLYNKGYEYIKWINPLMNSEPSPPLNTASLGPNLQHTNFGEDIKIQ
jgi:hypothetical protein